MFQAVTFLHTVMTHECCKVKTALIICPLNTVGNWFNEFHMWTKNAKKSILVHRLWESKNNEMRADALRNWRRQGGVAIANYDLYRVLVTVDKDKTKRYIWKTIEECLLTPGPDIVICDEGHLLKNDKTRLSIAANRMATKKRIILTGTPLQNNLIEYYTMMNFVKDGLLGTNEEFINRFVNPIRNGQHSDSTTWDVRVMKYRSHVLHKLLEGVVQRMDFSVLKPYLPPKFEYVINIRLTKKQEELYCHYVGTFVDAKDMGKYLFENYATLSKIWSHPLILTLTQKDQDDPDSEEESTERSFLEDLVASTKSAYVPELSKTFRPQKSAVAKKARKSNDSLGNVTDGWWSQFFSSTTDMFDITHSGKFVLLQQIIKACEKVKDKLLIFSHYLTSLNLIEEFLTDWDKEAVASSKPHRRWRKNMEYFRIDGSVSTDDRLRQCNKFNEDNCRYVNLLIFILSQSYLAIPTRDLVIFLHISRFKM